MIKIVVSFYGFPLKVLYKNNPNKNTIIAPKIVKNIPNPEPLPKIFWYGSLIIFFPIPTVSLTLTAKGPADCATSLPGSTVASIIDS